MTDVYMTDIIRVGDISESGLNDAAGGGRYLALGSFDGIHLGHQALLERTLALSCERGGVPCVLLHEPHPAKVIGADRKPRLLTTIEEKIGWIRRYGDFKVYILPFDLEFAGLSPEDFARIYLAGLFQVKSVIVGYNYRFGKGQSGNAGTLQRLGAELGFECVVTPRVTDAGGTVSSTSIRDLIENGAMYEAYASLGHCHVFRGEVVAGARIGSGLGYPTANIRLDADSIWPAYGVYGGFIMDDRAGIHKSVINVGVKPTLGEGRALASFEAHLLDFSGDLYNRELRVVLGRRIRPETRFESLDALKARIALDCDIARVSLDGWETFLREKDLKPESLFTCFIRQYPL